jgi:hypothetical protein
MADPKAEANKTVQENVDSAMYDQRSEEREAAGGGQALSPKDAAGMGASPDQAKMVGVKQPTSLEMALEQSKGARMTDQDFQYETMVREKHYEDSKLTPEQLEAEAMKEDLKDLGSLGNLVQTAVNKSLYDKPQTAEIEFSTDLITDTAATPEAEVEISTAMDAYIEEVQAAKGDTTKIAAANSKFVTATDGKFAEGTSATDLLTKLASTADVDENTINDAVASGIAEGVVDVDELTFTYLQEQGLLTKGKDGGYTQLDGLTDDELVGILGADYSTMTVAEISKAVDNTVTREFHQQANLQSTISDPNTSPVLREALQGQVAQFEASGAAVIEADAEGAARDVMAAGSVLFGGKVVEIETLLDDDFINAQATEFLLLDPDKRGDSQFFKDNPAFANMVEQTFDTAMKAGDSFEQAVETLKSTTDSHNKSITDDEAKMAMPPRPYLSNALGADKNGLHTGEFEPTAIWTAATSNPSVTQAMNQWSDDDIDTFMEFAADNETLAVEMLSNVKTAKSLTDILLMADLDNIVPVGDGGKDELQGLLNVAFGATDGEIPESGSVMESFVGIEPDKWLDKLKFDSLASGDPEARAALTKFKKILDADGDGVQDSPEQLRKTMKNMGSGGMAEVMRKASVLSSARTGAGDGGGINELQSSVEGGLNGVQVRDALMKPGIMEDGQINVAKLSAGFPHDGSSAQINETIKKLESVNASFTNMNPNQRKALEDEIERLGAEATKKDPQIQYDNKEKINKVTSSINSADDLMSALMKGGDLKSLSLPGMSKDQKAAAVNQMYKKVSKELTGGIEKAERELRQIKNATDPKANHREGSYHMGDKIAWAQSQKVKRDAAERRAKAARKKQKDLIDKIKEMFPFETQEQDDRE